MNNANTLAQHDDSEKVAHFDIRKLQFVSAETLIYDASCKCFKLGVEKVEWSSR
jgi:hypothetical protein